MSDSFTEEQKQYLQGFVAGSDLVRSRQGLSTFATAMAGAGMAASHPSSLPSTTRAEDVHIAAQNRFIEKKEKLCAEEQAKRDKNPYEMWDEIRENARQGKFPKGTDVFLYKYHGLFYVAPAQNSFMTRLRFPGGIVSAAQFAGVAEIADRCGAGHCDVTTRSNLQIREIGAHHAVDVITSLQDLGILNRGSGADNIRNITASPIAGIDPQELFDTRDLCREMHHYIQQHRELYGLPRKFNIAFDGGNAVSALADTNDIGFFAVKLRKDRQVDGAESDGPTYFRMELGGITGHEDFAKDAGILLTPEECVPVAAAVLRVFIREGDRTDRKKARLKYVIDRFGFDQFVATVEKEFGKAFNRVPIEDCLIRQSEQRTAHVGIHRQKQPGLCYVGVALPVGRLTTAQVRTLADLASCYGSGAIRLTPWQNLLISDIAAPNVDKVCQAIDVAGLDWRPNSVRAGLIACTGAAGCKYAASHTKQDALAIAEHLSGSAMVIDSPLNIHLTGCHHSCAQHYIGDIGMIGTKIAEGDEMVEGYHVFVGGGYGDQRGIASLLRRDVKSSEAPEFVHRLLTDFMTNRESESETFRDYARRIGSEQMLRNSNLVAMEAGAL